MADLLMYIPNDDRQNYLFCRLQLLGETFEHLTEWTLTNQYSLKVSKVVKPTNKKTLLKHIKKGLNAQQVLQGNTLNKTILYSTSYNANSK